MTAILPNQALNQIVTNRGIEQRELYLNVEC
jgi:hypothetical protein